MSKAQIPTIAKFLRTMSNATRAAKYAGIRRYKRGFIWFRPEGLAYEYTLAALGQRITSLGLGRAGARTAAARPRAGAAAGNRGGGAAADAGRVRRRAARLRRTIQQAKRALGRLKQGGPNPNPNPNPNPSRLKRVGRADPETWRLTEQAFSNSSTDP